MKKLDFKKTRGYSEEQGTLILLTRSNTLQEWIRCGNLEVDPPYWGTSSISAKFGAEVTDEEHGPAYAFSFYVAGMELLHIASGISTFGAWIAGSNNEFHVPNTDVLPASYGCERCASTHLVTAFAPPHNEGLYRELIGSRLEIRVGNIS